MRETLFPFLCSLLTLAGANAQAGTPSPDVSAGITLASNDAPNGDVVMAVLSDAQALAAPGADTNAPTLVDATGAVTFKRVKVWFSEPVDPASAQTAGNYRLSGGVTVSAAALQASGGIGGGDLVVLTTSQQPENTTLTLTVNNVKDLAGNKIEPNSIKIFTTFVWMPGQVLQESWDTLATNSIVALTNDTRFPTQPSSTSLEPMFEYPPNGGNEAGDNYGNKLSAWFTPPATGDYIFFINSDDASSLYLSTDADPANRKLIAQETGWSSPRRWVAANAGDAATKRSDKFEGNEWPPAAHSPIRLVAGKKYYIEALHTEGNGGDNVGATFIKAGAVDPAEGSAPALTGSVIGTYIDPNADLTWAKEPTDQPAILPSAGALMLSQDFQTNNGGFTVLSDPAPPGPWVYDSAAGFWAADGSDDGCKGPYTSRLTSPAYTVPESGQVTLSFVHRYSFESDYYDAGQVRVSVNGGEFTAVPATNFTANGYQPGDIAGTGILKGQRGFNGNSPDYTNGTFITSSAILGAFTEGDKTAVQFVGAWDECSGASKPSWAIKTVQLMVGKAATASTFEAEAVASLHGEPLPVRYQWQRQDADIFVDLPGETGPTLRIFPTAADLAATFRVMASVTGKSIVSEPVKLTTSVEPPNIAITATRGQITIQYTGKLQSASTVAGPYTDVQGASSPYTVPADQAAAFYRTVH